MAHIAIDARLINSSTGRYMERLVSYLQDIDRINQYTILVLKKDLDYWKPIYDNFSVVEANFPAYSIAEQTRFLELLNSLGADLVHFCMPQQPIRYTGRHITTIHDLTLLNTYNSDKNWFAYRVKQFIGRGIFKRIGHSSSQIITPSEYTKQAYVDFARIPSDKVTVTYEGADVSPEIPQEYSELEDKRFILYVGKQSDYKNIRRLIQAHQQLRERHPDLTLVLAGSLNEAAKRTQQWVTDNHYQGVHFTGFVDDAVLAWLYKHCEAYVFPSLMEGFGLPGLEAMAYGAPVASSNATCLPEIYGDAALYFDPKNTGEMTTVIEQLLTDPKLRVELISKGTARHQLYSWRRMAEQTLEVYQKTLDEITGK